MDGYFNVKPKIKKLSFEQRGKMTVFLEDGRVITVPLSAFPSIKKIPASKRKDYYLLGKDVFSWDCTNEVFHIEQILGCFDYYGHEADYHHGLEDE